MRGVGVGEAFFGYWSIARFLAVETAGIGVEDVSTTPLKATRDIRGDCFCCTQHTNGLKA